MAVTPRIDAVTASIDEHGFEADSIVGSFVHAYDAHADADLDLPSWQGRIVGEPQAGTYLVQVLDAMGKPTHQELHALDFMVSNRWAFYDSQEAMQTRYLELTTSMGAAR